MYFHFKYLAKYQRYKEIKKTAEATTDSPSKFSESLTSSAIGIWGKDLNKVTSSDKTAAAVSVVNKGSSVMKGLGRKILQNSLLMKVSLTLAANLLDNLFILVISVLGLFNYGSPNLSCHFG